MRFHWGSRFRKLHPCVKSECIQDRQHSASVTNWRYNSGTHHNPALITELVAQPCKFDVKILYSSWCRQETCEALSYCEIRVSLYRRKQTSWWRDVNQNWCKSHVPLLVLYLTLSTSKSSFLTLTLHQVNICCGFLGFGGLSSDVLMIKLHIQVHYKIQWGWGDPGEGGY